MAPPIPWLVAIHCSHGFVFTWLSSLGLSRLLSLIRIFVVGLRAQLVLQDDFIVRSLASLHL